MIEQLASQFAKSFTNELDWQKDGQAVISPSGKRFEGGAIEAQAYDLLVKYRDQMRRRMDSEVDD